jgi:Holliday junction DNA helicase RuvA
MIAMLRGRLRRRFDDRVLVECGGIGYEVFLPPVAMKGLPSDDDVELHIHYHATRDQPRPVLIGFVSDLDREFFEKLITVKDVGPLVAARALAAPVAELAAAIVRQDEGYLRRLPGIGPQKAKNIVAQLQAKVAKFALVREGAPPGATSDDGVRAGPSRAAVEGSREGAPVEGASPAVLDGATARATPAASRPPSAETTTDHLRSLVWDVLVKQLGHRPSEASQLITDAFRRKPDLATPEELFDEIYRGRG